MLYAATRRGFRARVAWPAFWQLVSSLRDDPRRRWAFAFVGLLIADLTVFGHVVEDYLTGDPIVRWDVNFAAWLHDHVNGSLLAVFQALTLAGNSVVLALLVAVVCIALLRRAQVNSALLLGSVFVGSEVLNALLKLAFHRPRPEVAFVHLETYSFPSGHATVSAAVYGLLTALAVARLRTSRRRVAVVAAASALIGLIAFSRLYLGVHYLSDVIAGLTEGFAWVCAAVIVMLLLGDHDLSVWLPRPLRRLLWWFVPRENSLFPNRS